MVLQQALLVELVAVVVLLIGVLVWSEKVKFKYPFRVSALIWLIVILHVFYRIALG